MNQLTTDPEALLAAATNLEGIGSALTAQNSAAASPITGLLPAAADEVSALQAAQFAAYGTLYEQISAQATAIQELFVHTLRTSADSYQATEAANTVAASPAAAAGAAAAGTGQATPSALTLGSVASNSSILATMNGGNIGSALSEFTSLGKGFITEPAGFSSYGAYGLSAGLSGPQSSLASATTPAPAGGVGPVAAGTGQASSMSKLSTPPTWTEGAASTVEPTPARLAAAEWTAPATHAGPGSTMSTGMPAAASADRGGHGYGKPRYGVKPTVMPQPEVV